MGFIDRAKDSYRHAGPPSPTTTIPGNAAVPFPQPNMLEEGVYNVEGCRGIDLADESRAPQASWRA